jgi:hypothetical protein
MRTLIWLVIVSMKLARSQDAGATLTLSPTTLQFGSQAVGSHPPILQRQQPAIGNRHAVRVPRQVLQDLWGAAESGLTVHHPIWPIQGGHEIGEAGGVSRCAKSVRSI